MIFAHWIFIWIHTLMFVSSIYFIFFFDIRLCLVKIKTSTHSHNKKLFQLHSTREIVFRFEEFCFTGLNKNSYLIPSTKYVTWHILNSLIKSAFVYNVSCNNRFLHNLRELVSRIFYTGRRSYFVKNQSVKKLKIFQCFHSICLVLLLWLNS